MRIYTRSGDSGETGLFGGQRVPKDDLRIEAYGTVDELNAVLGMARVHAAGEELEQSIAALQSDLFSLGADMATPREEDTHKGRIVVERVGPEQVERLEAQIDHYEAELPPLQSFILPGGHPLAAALHLARVVCRRAERRSVSLQHSGEALNPEVLRYLNRLSDLLFVLARVANQRQNVPDIAWKPDTV